MTHTSTPDSGDPAQIDALLDQADAALGEGRLDAAQAGFEAVLKLDPGQYDALHLLGVVAMQRQQWPQALRWIEQAIAVDPDAEMAYVSLGAVFMAQNQADRAEAAFAKAVAIDAAYPEAQFGLGMCRVAQQRWQEALAPLGEVVRLQPHHVEAWANLGSAYLGLGRMEESLLSSDKALALQPAHGAALINKAQALAAVGRPGEALPCFDAALAMQPHRMDLQARRGDVLLELGRLPEAVQAYDLALRDLPQRFDVWANRGNALLGLRRVDEAIASYEAALKIQPDNLDVQANLAGACREAGRLDEAEALCDAVLRQRPEHAGAWMNRGNVLLDRGQLAQAREAFARTAALQPANPHAHWAQGWVACLQGDWTQGLPLLEARWRKPGQALPQAMGKPLWTGEMPLAGKTILLRAEQGLGDTLQFARYAALLKARGAKVLLEVQPALKRLLGSLQGVDACLVQGQMSLTPFDCYVPLMSLPMALGTTPDSVPAAPSYLKADAGLTEVWGQRLGPRTQPRIGLVWSGNAAHRDDHRRSMSLARMLQALPTGMQYVCLQKDIRDEDMATMQARSDVVYWPEALQTFDATAALMQHMDVVVSVDTSIAHLAGALGRPVWILLTAMPDWRWLTGRTDTPWYPSATLYRQPVAGDWDTPLKAVSQALVQRFMH